MPLAGVVPLDAVRLVLARIELSDRQPHGVLCIVIRTIEARVPARQPLASGFVPTAAVPVWRRKGVEAATKAALVIYVHGPSTPVGYP